MNNEEWTRINDQWWMTYEEWTRINDHWRINNEELTRINDHWRMNKDQWSMNNKRWRMWCEYGVEWSKNPLNAFKNVAKTTLDTHRTNKTFYFVKKQKGDKNNSSPSLSSSPPPHTQVRIHSLNSRGNDWILSLLHSQRQHSGL